MSVDQLCPPQDDLSNYLIGRLPHAIMARVADHLERCSTCQIAIGTVNESPDPLLAELRQLAGVGMAAIGAVDSVQLAQAAALLGPASAEPRALATWPEHIAAYRLEEKLGQGGMGAVYRATHMSLGKTVAIKLLARERMTDAAAQARFHREIRAVGQLQHANIVSATDAGEADGWHYLVMEYVEGWDLSRLVRALGPLPIADACEIVRQAALALMHVQTRRLVHRDIKPSNLMLTRDGHVKLLDLGLAALLRDELRAPVEADRDLTQAQQILGTIEYIAPEQLRDSRTVDVRADLYGLGGTLFKLLTGSSPFQHAGEQISPLQLAAHHLQTPAPDVRALRPEVPAELAAVVARLLAKRPEERYASPQELCEQLAPLAARADLTKLATRAAATTLGGIDSAAVSRTSTIVHLSSAMSETDTRPLPALPAEPILQPVPQIAVERRSPRRAGLIALGVLGLAALATVILYVRNTRVEVPDGSEVTVAADGTIRVKPPEDAELKNDRTQQPATSRTPPWTKLDRTMAGQPLSRLALVAHPAEVQGVASWSLETVGHRGEVLGLAISPDEKWLASAGKDGTVRIWNLHNGALAAMLLGHGELVNRLVWSPDSQLLLSADPQASYVWDVARGTRRKLHEFKTNDNFTYNSFGWSAPGHVSVAWIGDEHRFQRIDLATGKVHEPFESTAANFHRAAVAYSPDGRFIATADGRQAHILDATTGKVLNSVPAVSEQLFFAWSPDGKRLAFANLLGVVEVWEPRGKKPLLQVGEPAASPWVVGLLWSHDSRDVIAYGHEALHVWNAAAGERRSYPAAHTAVHQYRISTTGAFVATAFLGDITVYSGEGKLLWSQLRRQSSAQYVNWSPDGKHLAYWWSADDGTGHFIVVASASDGTVLSRRKHENAYDMRWTSDGRELAIARDDGKLDFVDPLSDKTLRTLATGHEGPFQLRISSNGKQLATGDALGNVKMWTLGSDKPDHVIENLRSDIRMEWSPDGALLAVTEIDRPHVQIYSGLSGKLVQTCTSPVDSQIVRIVWSPDSRSLVANGSHAPSPVVFDVSTGDFVRQIDARPGGHGFLWPTNNRMAFFRLGPYVRWWNWDEGRFEAPIASYDLDVYTQPAAPDRRTIASPQVSGALFIWDFTTGERHGTLVPLTNRQQLVIDPAGGYRMSHPSIASDLRIVAEIDGRQQLFTPSAFTQQFDWKNDAAGVRLSPDWAVQTQPKGQP